MLRRRSGTVTVLPCPKLHVGVAIAIPLFRTGICRCVRARPSVPLFFAPVSDYERTRLGQASRGIELVALAPVQQMLHVRAVGAPVIVVVIATLD